MPKIMWKVRFLTPYTMIFISLTSVLPACAVTPEEVVPRPKPAKTVTATSQSSTVSSDVTPDMVRKFKAWKTDFIQRAINKGYDKAEVTRLISAAQINPLALDRDKKQPEFVKPVWTYIEGAASQSRIDTGLTKLANTRATFDQVEARYGVPRQILTAIWGLETSYGRILGRHNIIDALATFAFDGRRQKFGEEQLFATLDLLKSKAVRPEQLIGSWAGAMGMTQFIPTTFRDYAVDFDGNGNKDLWGSKGDALGSAAHYLKRSGWQSNQPVVAEVVLPTGFDFSQADGRRKTVGEWEAIGVRPYNNRNWSEAARRLNAKLLVPAGETGPTLLTFKNFDAIKRYNNSTSYVLGITSLADAFDGNETIQKPWPKGETPLTFSERKKIQAKLTSIGYDTKGVDGQIGPNSRKAIRAWQADNGFAQDGYITRAQLKKMLKN